MKKYKCLEFMLDKQNKPYAYVICDELGKELTITKANLVEKLKKENVVLVETDEAKEKLRKDRLVILDDNKVEITERVIHSIKSEYKHLSFKQVKSIAVQQVKLRQ